jgi:hypothetical protein
MSRKRAETFDNDSKSPPVRRQNLIVKFNCRVTAGKSELPRELSTLALWPQQRGPLGFQQGPQDRLLAVLQLGRIR